MMFSLGAFAIIFDDQNRVLLCHRTDMDVWNLPGGGVEEGELPTEAAIREVKEETGLEIAIAQLIGIYTKPDADDCIFTFLGQQVGGELTLTNEARDLQYFALNQIPRNIFATHLGRIYDVLNCNTFPIFRRQTESSVEEIWQKLQGFD